MVLVKIKFIKKKKSIESDNYKKTNKTTLFSLFVELLPAVKNYKNILSHGTRK